jgi:hypothetical protein
MQVRNVEDNLDRSLVDANGNPLPPCIVMERGESLDLWVGRAQPDSTQALAVRCSSCATSMFDCVVASCQPLSLQVHVPVLLSQLLQCWI